MAAVVRVSIQSSKVGAVHLELMRDKRKLFPDIASPKRFVTARVWHCRYETLAPLESLTALEGLDIATYPDASLEPLAGLSATRA